MENSTEQPKAYQLRKEVKRLAKSRDNIKAKSRDKAHIIKDYQDRLREVTESRNRWKEKLKEEKQNCSQLQDELHRQNEALSELQEERDQILSEFRQLQKKMTPHL